MNSNNVHSVICETCAGVGEGYTLNDPCPECGAWQPRQRYRSPGYKLEPRVVKESPEHNRKDRRRREAARRATK